MRVTWFGRRGCERSRNSDAAAIAQRGQQCLAIVVDGAEKGPNSVELARYWANAVLERALAKPSPLSEGVVNGLLKREQGRLHHGSLRDIASYCLVSLDTDTLGVRIWHCGNCRVGLALPFTHICC